MATITRLLAPIFCRRFDPDHFDVSSVIRSELYEPFFPCHAVNIPLYEWAGKWIRAGILLLRRGLWHQCCCIAYVVPRLNNICMARVMLYSTRHATELTSRVGTLDAIRLTA